jgi:hypothetical protein
MSQFITKNIIFQVNILDYQKTLNDTFEIKGAQQVPIALQQTVKYTNQTDHAIFNKGEE